MGFLLYKGLKKVSKPVFLFIYFRFNMLFHGRYTLNITLLSPHGCLVYIIFLENTKHELIVVCLFVCLSVHRCLNNVMVLH